MNYYNLDVDKVLKELKTSKNGISTKEALRRINEYGKNVLAEKKKESNLKKFLNEFKNMMIIVLIIAAIFSFVSSIINNESIIDSIIIIAIVILNAILGFIQELKADKAIDSLKKMQTAQVRVKREGHIHLINTEDLVVGDILVLEAGDTVPADARIIYVSSLKTDESSLTGESLAVDKDIEKLPIGTELSVRKNMIYSGTSIVYGKCEAVVCETGMATEFGKIAASLNIDEKEVTPLQKKIDGISKYLSVIIAIIILVMFLIGIIKRMELMEVIMISISLAVAAIPEGLPAVITIILSLGMNELAKKKAIVRKMSSVETLGSTEVICSDKTGTITQNRMVVEEIYFNNKISKKVDDDIFKAIMVLNNDSTKTNNDYIGDPTEIALYQYCESKMDIEKFRIDNKRIYEIPFDSERKMMSTINTCGDTDINRLYTKGSFDSLIECCSYIYEDGKVNKLTINKKKELKVVEMSESDKAYRILAYAYKDIDTSVKADKDLESDLIFIGMTAMIDPPRVDVKDAILACKNANIKPVMITGDSLSTAKAIAREIGIMKDDSEALTGTDIDNMSYEELKLNINNYSVYARVSPMNKLSIVKAWKENNKIVAMTGDGVNDAPALKTADIGVGMGITGTEVSKSVSDIILSDDSFSTIVTAVKEGRRIFDNIRNTLVYLLAGNLTEILLVFIGMVFGIEFFSPIQLLYINLITDSIPAIALAFEKETADVMVRGARKNTSTFFTPFLISKLILSSVLKTVTLFMIYLVNIDIYGAEVATTMSFLTLILFEMIYAFSCKNLKRTVLNKNFFNNGYLNKSMILLIIIQLVVFITPVKNIFDIADIGILQLLYCLFIVIITFVIDEISKSILVSSFKD